MWQEGQPGLGTPVFPWHMRPEGREFSSAHSHHVQVLEAPLVLLCSLRLQVALLCQAAATGPRWAQEQVGTRQSCHPARGWDRPSAQALEWGTWTRTEPNIPGDMGEGNISRRVRATLPQQLGVKRWGGCGDQLYQSNKRHKIRCATLLQVS